MGSEQHRWSAELVTDLSDLRYDFREHAGILNMPGGCCCDMAGCINLFQRIDPKVKLILTYADSKLDTIYHCEGKGWEAYTHNNQGVKVDILLKRILAPREELRELIKLGYASKHKDLRELAGMVDSWLAKQEGAVGYLHRRLLKDKTEL